jgi:hypothetical protein
MDVTNNQQLINKEVLKEKMKSKKYKILIHIVSTILLLLIGFAVGVKVGLHKARFSNDFGRNYEKNFMGPRRGGPMGMFDDFEGRGMRNPHGIAGSIISISDNSLVIKDRDNKENTITVTDKTIIKNGRDTKKINDLKTGDEIVVLGRPGDNGTVNADLIRIFNPSDNPSNDIASPPQDDNQNNQTN